MQRQEKRNCAALAALAIAGSVAALPAYAQQATAPTNTEATGALDTVIVTARRREENVQDVPIAVNVFSADAIVKQDIRTFTDLERMMPGVSTCCTRGGVSQFTFIRGVNSSAGYFAEVPTLLNGNAMFFDIGNVQVLKGPQGTLFGIATNGGAILNEPKRPTELLEGYAGVTLGENNRRTIEGVINLPVSDKLLLRVGAQKQEIDGYVHDITNNRDLGNEDYWTGRVSATWKIADGLENYTVVNYHSSDRMPEPLGIPYGPTAGINPTGLFRSVFNGPALDAWIAQSNTLGRYEIVGTSVPGGPRSVLKQTNAVDILTYEINDNLTIKNIAGFVQTKGYTISDTDASPFLGFETSLPTQFNGPSNQYSEELQLQGNGFDRKLTYVVGTFNRWQRVEDPQASYSYSLGSRSGSLSIAEGETYSLFAEGTYALDSVLEGLNFTAGYRYTWDEREASQKRFNTNEVQVSAFAADGKWGEGSYRWGFTYQFNPDVMVYFTNSKGYSAGGFNLTAPPQYQKYDPESLDNFEVGIKSEWSIGDVQGRANLTAYYGKWDSIQVQVTSRCETATGPVLCQLTRNAATGTIKGFEGEFAIVPWEWLQVSGNFGYMWGRYDDFVGLDPTGTSTLDLSGTRFLYLPKWKYSVSTTLKLPFPESVGRVSLSGTYGFTDDINCCFTLGPPQYWTTSPSMDNLNVSLKWDEVAGHAPLSAAFAITNALQNENLQGQWGGYETVGQYARAVAVPRLWTVSLNYKF